MHGPRTWDDVFEYGPGFEEKYPLAGGAMRADAVNPDLRIVLELKPNNWQAIRRGLNQLSRYIDQLNKEYPGDVPWSGQVVTYDP